MAESQEPEGEAHRARPRDKTLHQIEVHRVNDFLLGHIGQVSYDPADDEEADIGALDFSRACEHREFLPNSESFSSFIRTFT